MSIQKQDLRAVIWPLLHPDTGLMYCDRFSWRDLEEQAGMYTFEGIAKALRRAGDIKRYALIHIRPDQPGWCQSPAADCIRLIDALGKAFGNDRAVLGIDVLCPGMETERSRGELAAIADAFRRAFPHAVKYVRAGSAFDSILKDDRRKGLILTPESVRDHADRWKNMPLRMAVNPSNPEEIRFAIDHHVSVLETDDPAQSNAATHAGHRFQFQRVEIDDTQKEIHKIKATVVFANVGTLPCYTDARFCIRLSGSDVDCERVFPLPLQAFDVTPGSRISITQTLDTQGMPSGEYDVQAGLFCEGTQYPISFGIEGRISDGYYEGRLILCL